MDQRSPKTGLPQLPKASNCFTCQGRERSEWCSLQDEDLKLLNDHKICNVYEPGQVLFYEGNPCLGIYCIETGSVALRKGDGRGGSVVLGIHGAGQTLGYTAYFSERPYSSTAEALSPARVCFVDRAAVRTLLQRNPSLGLKFLKRFATDLSDAQVERVMALSMPLRARMAHLLLVLKDRASTVDDEGNIIVELPLSRQDMASMLGARPESISRTIRQFQDEAIAQFHARDVVVPDLDALIDELEAEPEQP
jgi:CRP/FNR family transcriptional regulator